MLTGRALAPADCSARRPNNAGLESFKLYSVFEAGMLSITAFVFEEYVGGERCYLVSGTSKMRSTFTTACEPADDDPNYAAVLPCAAPIDNSYGYTYFTG